MSDSNIYMYSIKSSLEILENQSHSAAENFCIISFSDYFLIFREETFTQEQKMCYFSGYFTQIREFLRKTHILHGSL